MFFRAAFLAAALLIHGQSAAAARSPQDSLHSFYVWVLAHPKLTLPSQADRTELSEFLAPGLLRLLAAASETQTRCLEITRQGEKPGLPEGAMFVGNYDGATEVAYGRLQQGDAAARVEVSLVYIDRRFPKAHAHRLHAWTDQVELSFSDSRWLVDDIRFERGRSLAAGLAQYLVDGARDCGRPLNPPAALP
jgi:hypothetical protein